MIPGILHNNARTVALLVDALLKRFNLSIINLIILVVSDAIITYLSVIVIAFPLAHDSLCFQIVLREQSFCGVNCWWAGLVSQYCSICAKQSSHYNTYVNNKYNNVLVMLLRTYVHGDDACFTKFRAFYIHRLPHNQPPIWCCLYDNYIIKLFKL